MRCHITVSPIEDWRHPAWDDDVPSRTGWLVTCSEHGDLGRGWRYNTSGIAQSVGTRHARKKPHAARGTRESA
jgi:hypothetical protein